MRCRRSVAAHGVMSMLLNSCELYNTYTPNQSQSSCEAHARRVSHEVRMSRQAQTLYPAHSHAPGMNTRAKTRCHDLTRSHAWPRDTPPPSAAADMQGSIAGSQPQSASVMSPCRRTRLPPQKNVRNRHATRRIAPDFRRLLRFACTPRKSPQLLSSTADLKLGFNATKCLFAAQKLLIFARPHCC